MDFNVTFNWTYPDEDWHDISVHATSTLLPDAWYNVTDAYRVENDVDLIGGLEVLDENLEPLDAGSLVKGGELLTFTGVTAVYQNTTDVYPPSDSLGIRIWDEDGSYEDDTYQPGVAFYEDIVAPNGTIAGHTWRVNFTGIPPECDASNVTFTLYIDADNVTFTNPTPDNAMWQNESLIPVAVTIIDTGGGMVHGDMVEFALSTDNGTTWDPWSPAPALTAPTVNAATLATFPDGATNLVKWCATDTLGNGPSESPAYRILVDTTPPEFSNCHPQDTAVSNSQLNLVGIDIHDETSGVDVSSTEYSISTDGGTAWGEWTGATGVKDGRYTHCEVEVTFPDGDQNRVKWRARDIAGNSAESGAYIVNVDIRKDPPKVELLSPLDEAVLMEDRGIELIWQLAEGSPVASSFNVYMGHPHKLMILLVNGTTNMSHAFVPSDPGLYAWTVLPVSSDGREGLCLSGNWTFTIEHCPGLDYAVEVDPIAPVEMFAGDMRTIEVTVWNHGIYTDTLMFSLESGELGLRAYISTNTQAVVESGMSTIVGVNITLENKDMPAGDYTLTFTAVSKGALENGWEVEDNESFIVTFPSEPYDPGPGGGGGDGNETDGGDGPGDSKEGVGDTLTWAVVVTVLVIVVVVGLILFMATRKKKVDEPEDPGGEIPTVDLEKPGKPALSGPVRVIPAETVDVEANVKGPDGQVPRLTTPVEAEASTGAPVQPTPVAMPGAVAPVPVLAGGVIGSARGVEAPPPAADESASENGHI